MKWIVKYTVAKTLNSCNNLTTSTFSSIFQRDLASFYFLSGLDLTCNTCSVKHGIANGPGKVIWPKIT